MKRTLVSLATVASFALGCGAGRPPNQLVDARIAYQQASQHPAARSASVDLLEAKQALDAAERAYRDGNTEEAKNLGYIAHRRALAAQARADTTRAVETKRVALAEFQRFREMQALASRAELERAKGELSIAQQEAESQRQAREAAEEKLSQIAGVQSQKTEKGVTLTISGSVLFPSGKAELLPAAKDRLAEVAQAVKDDNRTILVVGHSDALEPPDERLSEARANAVRIFLVQQGIQDSRIRSEGMGRSQPIADNATPEGRANNRRVEIVLEASPGSGHTEMPKKEEPGGPAKAKTPEQAPKQPQPQPQPQPQAPSPQPQPPMPNHEHHK